MRVFLLLLLTLACVACAGAPNAPGTVSLYEFGIDTAPSQPTGTTSVQVVNEGQFSHTLVVSRSDGTVVDSTPVLAPGEAVDLELDLTTGKYEFTCRIVVEVPGRGVVDHYEAGMKASVSAEA